MARRPDVRADASGVRVDDLRAGGSTRDRTVRVTGDLAEDDHTAPRGASHRGVAQHRRITVDGAAPTPIAVSPTSSCCAGDPPGDPLGPWEKHPDGVEYAEELVRLVCGLGDFHVGVASFPEGHHRAPDLEHDTKHLVAKLRAGRRVFDHPDVLRRRGLPAAARPRRGVRPRAGQPSRSFRRSCRSRRSGRSGEQWSCPARRSARGAREAACAALPATVRTRTAPRCARSASSSRRRWESG